MLLVHREREHARIGFEDERGAVAVMHVEIDDRRALDAARLQHADRDGDVVERAEAFAVIRKGVVETAAEMRPTCNAEARLEVSKRACGLHACGLCVRGRTRSRGLDRSAGHQPKTVDHLLRPRQLELRDVLRRHRAVAHLSQIFRRVNEGEVVPARGRWFDDSDGFETPVRSAGVNQAVLLGGKNVRPEIDAIPG